MAALAFGCRCLLIGVFAVSGASKLWRADALRAFAASLVGMRLVPVRWARAVAVAVAACELAVVAVLCVPPAAAVGFGGAAAVLVALTAGIGWTLARGASVPCRCFGASQRPLGRVHLARNAVLLLVAVAGGAAQSVARAPVPPAGIALAVFFAALGLLATVYLDDVVSLFRPQGVSS